MNKVVRISPYVSLPSGWFESVFGRLINTDVYLLLKYVIPRITTNIVPDDNQFTKLLNETK